MGITGIQNAIAHCPHVTGVERAVYLRNDGQLPPAVFVQDMKSAVLILTNQKIYVKCIDCWLSSQLAATDARNTLIPPRLH